MRRQPKDLRYEELRQENSRMLSGIIELTKEVTALKAELKGYRDSHPQTMHDNQRAQLRKWLADPEMIEACRQAQWVRTSGHDRYWSDAKGDYDFPEGFPEGETVETVIAKSLGFDLVLGAPSEKTLSKVFAFDPLPAAPQRTFLHKLLDDDNG